MESELSAANENRDMGLISKLKVWYIFRKVYHSKIFLLG